VTRGERVALRGHVRRALPYSLVFHCVPLDDLDGRWLKGKDLRDLVSQILEASYPDDAKQVGSVGVSSFTVSPFFAKRCSSHRGGYSGGKSSRSRVEMIRAGTPCRFRLTLLDDKDFEAVVSLIEDPTAVLSVSGKSLTVTHVLSRPSQSDPWPCSQTYRKLFDEASSTCKVVRLQFVTPTTFISPAGSLPLPDPQRVFRGFLKSWSRFALTPLSADMKELIDHHVCLREFRISSINYDSGEGIIASFTGWGQFALEGRHHEKHIREFNILAGFSFYCGTGDRTEIGMGVTRRL